MTMNESERDRLRALTVKIRSSSEQRLAEAIREARTAGASWEEIEQVVPPNELVAALAWIGFPKTQQGAEERL